MSAIIILPNGQIDINKYIDSFTSKNLYKLINGLDYAKVHIELPKFEIEFSEDIKEIMRDLGMEK